MTIGKGLPKAVLRYLGFEKIPSHIEIEQPEFHIGSSSDNDLSLPTGKVSRHHAQIAYDYSQQRYALIDLRSTNGTYIHGQKISPQCSHILEHEAHIQFSLVPFQFLYKSDTDLLTPSEVVPLGFKPMEKGQIFTSSRNIRYQIDKPLKKGSMGSLFKARNFNDNTTVIIKFLPAHESNNPKSVLRFITEAYLIIDMEHKHIVKGLDFYHGIQHCFFVMEYIRGSDIDSLLTKYKRIPLKLSLQIALQISRALVYLEQKEICHRDIKPANIIWSYEKIAKLVDFGIVKTGDVALTTKGIMLGTPFYVSPEQILGQKLDGRSDIYSLGATLYHMLTGVAPFSEAERNIQKMMSRRLQTTPRPANLIHNKIPQAVTDLLTAMMSPKVEQRIATAKKLPPLFKKFLKKLSR